MNETLSEKIKANRKEYERLMKDDDYTDVRFNPKNGALSAIHKEHNFDTYIGKFGIERGDYERNSVDILYDSGKKIILGSEIKPEGIKSNEGFLDDKKFDIKGVEGTGKRNIEYKLYEASGQDAETVVLYYPDKSVFSKQRIIDDYAAYMRNSKSKKIKMVCYIVDNNLHVL